MPISSLQNKQSLPSNKSQASHSMAGKKRRHSFTSSQDSHHDTPATKTSQGRHVSFASSEQEVFDAVLPPCSTMTPSEKSELWYSREALNSFKDVARQEGRLIRIAESSNDELTKFSEDEPNEQRRKAEARICFQRQRNRLIAQRAVLETQRRLVQKEDLPASCSHVAQDLQLALVASKITRWSREIALATGQNDLIAAFPELSGLVRPGLSLQEINEHYPFPLVTKGKRAVADPAVVEKCFDMPRSTTPPTSSRPETPPASPSSVPDFTPGAIPTTLKNLAPEMMMPFPEEEDSDDEARRRLLTKKRKMMPEAA